MIWESYGQFNLVKVENLIFGKIKMQRKEGEGNLSIKILTRVGPYAHLSIERWLSSSA
jgi:hypothetical protein